MTSLFDQAFAPYQQPTNVLQQILGGGFNGGALQTQDPGPLSLPAPDFGSIKAPTVRQPRERSSLLDIIGGISDAIATVGGAPAQYQSSLDAAAERQRQVDLDATRKRITDQQIRMGDAELGNLDRERLAQVLGGISGSENAGQTWRELASITGIPADKVEAIGQMLDARPERADVLARSFGYQPAAQGSLPKELQLYGLLQQLRPDLADQYLESVASGGQITPYQMAQLRNADRSFGLQQRQQDWSESPNNPSNQRKTAASGGASDVAQILQDNGITLSGKDDPVADLIRESTNGWVESLGSYAAGVFGRTTPGQAAIGRLETIDNSVVLALAGGKLGQGVSEGDRKFFERMSGRISDPTIPMGQRLAAWAQVRTRLKAITERAPSNRSVRGGQVNPALEAELRRRGLTQ